MAIAVIIAITFLLFLLKPLYAYLYDAKNLRKYPNQNPLSGISSLSYIWEHISGFRTKHLHELHRKHPIIRVGPNTLSFGDVRAIKDIYGHSTPCRKDRVYTIAAGQHLNIFNVVDRDEHTRKRRMLSHAFSTQNLELWEFKVRDKVEKLVGQFDQRCTAPVGKMGVDSTDEGFVDFRRWSNLFTIDAIADIALSEKLHMLESGTDKITLDDQNQEQLSFLESLHHGNRMVSIIIGTTGWFPTLKYLSDLLSGYFHEQWEHGRNFGRIVHHLAKKRLQRFHDGEELDDFSSYLTRDKAGNARGLDPGEIEAEVNILMDAGSDTTAIALTHVMYYLLKNPKTLSALRNEVSTVFPNGDPIASYAKVKNLPYLKACLDESLRLSPPLSRGLERRTPPEGMQIAGEHISGDIRVSVPAYAAHRDPAIFPDPEAYRPERWLEKEEVTQPMRAVFIPFSTGARACIGRNVTMIEQQMLLATLVHRYEFALPSKEWTLDWEEAFNLWTGKMPLKIWKRAGE